MSLVSATSNKIVVPSLPDPMPEGKTRDDYFLCPDVNDADFLEKNLREGNFLFVYERYGTNRQVQYKRFRNYAVTATASWLSILRIMKIKRMILRHKVFMIRELKNFIEQISF